MSKLSSGVSLRQSKEECWSHHIESWSTSDLTQVRYCQEHNLKIATFHYWKSKLEQQSRPRPLLPVSIQPAIKPILSSFSSGISIPINDQLRIELDVGFNGDTLLKTLDLLKAR